MPASETTPGKVRSEAPADDASGIKADREASAAATAAGKACGEVSVVHTRSLLITCHGMSRHPGVNSHATFVRPTDEEALRFWFFADGNVEQLVKVLNACGLPGFNNFWVFAAGLTNVEVTLTVTDVRTGQTKQYVNPIGVAFQPVQDTTDFRSCP